MSTQYAQPLICDTRNSTRARSRGSMLVAARYGPVAESDRTASGAIFTYAIRRVMASLPEWRSSRIVENLARSDHRRSDRRRPYGRLQRATSFAEYVMVL